MKHPLQYSRHDLLFWFGLSALGFFIGKLFTDLNPIDVGAAFLSAGIILSSIYEILKK